MKMAKTDFDRLKKAIEDANETQMFTLTEFKENYKAAGLTEKRYRWDMWYCIPQAERVQMMRDFYEYLNDDHIDTALRKIMA